jgi:hypothetical protein
MYGTFTLSYNLARKAADRHLDKSVAAYAAWKTTQVDDVAHQSLLLKEQIEVTIDTQQGQLLGLLAHAEQTAKDIKALDGVETSNALAFRNTLRADQIVLNVEIEDLKFRLDKQQRFIADNF